MPDANTRGLRLEQMSVSSLDQFFTSDIQNLMLSAGEHRARVQFKKDMFKSGLLMPVDYSNTENQGVQEFFATNNEIKNKYYEGFYTRPKLSLTISDANKFYIAGKPHKFNVNGVEIYLSSNDSEFLNSIVLPPPPVTGTRQDKVVLEVWAEEIIFDVSNSDVIFPYGNTQYNSQDNAFNDCVLSNQNLFGGNFPAYLANSQGHGQYVLINDPNIMRMILDPVHNIFVDINNRVFQVRYRIATLENELSHTAESPYLFDIQHLYYRPQGQLANRPARGIQYENFGIFVRQDGSYEVCSYEHDSGLYKAGWFVDEESPLQPITNEISYDGEVYAIPLALVFRRNSTPYEPVLNPNGAGLIASGISGRDDGLYADQVFIDDVINLVQMAQRNVFIPKEKPTGLLNGFNKTFYIRNLPVAGSEHVFLNGQLLDNQELDYTLEGRKLIISNNYEVGPNDKLRVSYITK